MIWLIDVFQEYTSVKKEKEFGIRYICNPMVNVDPTRGERPEFVGPFRPRMQMLVVKIQ